MAIPGSAELANQLEVGEFVVLEGLRLEGNELKPLFTPNRPVRLEALTDLRLFLRFGRPPGKLESYYTVHVISAEIEVDMKVWPLVPAILAIVLMLLVHINTWSDAVLMMVSVACFLGFARMKRVLEISVAGGRRFRFFGNREALEGVADRMQRELKKRDAHSDAVYKAPPPIIFPPVAVPHPLVVKATAASLPALRPEYGDYDPSPKPAPVAVKYLSDPLPEPSASDLEFRFCHMCGNRVNRHSRYCPECGERQ
jgi:hypothetical protein